MPTFQNLLDNVKDLDQHKIARIESIKKIGELDFDILLPGHGPAIMKEAQRKVRKIVA